MSDQNGLTDREPAGQAGPPVIDQQVSSWKGAADPAGAPRRKVTAADLEAKFASRRAERQAHTSDREPRDMGKLIRMVAASLLGVGIIGFALGADASQRQFALDSAANEKKAASLAGALETLKPANGENTVQVLVDGLAAARVKADELAAGQQKFAVISHDGNEDPGTNDGRPKASVLRSLDQRRALAGFFAQESLVLTDAEAYTFRTEDLLGPGTIDPRLPWFLRYEPAGGDGIPAKASDPGSYSWKTVSVTPSGTPKVFSVVWTNTDTAGGDLLSWATARYSSDTGTFSDLRVHRTTQGENQQLKPETVSTEGTDA